MKHLAFLVSLLLVSVAGLTSCVSPCGFKSPLGVASLCGKKLGGCGGSNCSSCATKQTFPHQGCETGKRFIEKEVTEYVEEQIVVEGKGPKSSSETITVRRPVTKIVKVEVPCGDCGSKFCATPDCCGITPVSVLSRATVQGGTGEPHLGNIPTMKVLVDGARENGNLMN